MHINSQLKLWSSACLWYHPQNFWRSLASLRWTLWLRRLNGLWLHRVLKAYERERPSFAGSSSYIQDSSTLRPLRRSYPCLFRYLLSCFRSPRGFKKSQQSRSRRSGCSYVTTLRGTEGVHLWCRRCSLTFLSKNEQYFIAPSRNYSSHFQWHRTYCYNPVLTSSKNAENWTILVFFCSAWAEHPLLTSVTLTLRFFRQWNRYWLGVLRISRSIRKSLLRSQFWIRHHYQDDWRIPSEKPLLSSWGLSYCSWEDHRERYESRCLGWRDASAFLVCGCLED